MPFGNGTQTYRSPTTGRLLPMSNMTAQEVTEYNAWLASGGAANGGISALPKWLVWGGLLTVVYMMWKQAK